jgi:hypothetical protein
MTTWRLCKTCETKRPEEDFYKKRDKKDGLMSKCKFCHNDKVRSKYNPIKKKAQHLKYKYGITLEEYNSKLEEQDNECAICCTETPSGKGTYFYVDHNHTTKLVRGLLCHNCNFVIGYARENINILNRAVQYLETWRES